MPELSTQNDLRQYYTEKYAPKVRDENPPKELLETDALAQKLFAALERHSPKTIETLNSQEPLNPLFDLVFADALLGRHEKAGKYYYGDFCGYVKKRISWNSAPQSIQATDYLNEDWIGGLYEKLLKYCGKYNGYFPLLPYAVRMVRNGFNDIVKRKKMVVNMPKDENGTPKEFEDNSELPQDLCVLYRELFQNARRKFDDDEWDLLSLKYFCGNQSKDIAATCGISETKICRKLKELEERFRKTLDKELIGSGLDQYRRQISAILGELFVSKVERHN